MPRRLVISLVIIILVAAALAAVAAVETLSTPTLQVTPLVHSEGNEGYFRLSVPLPHGTLPLAVTARVTDGDAWLVNARISGAV